MAEGAGGVGDREEVQGAVYDERALVMGRSAYGRVQCHVCKRDISTAGFAQYNHKMKHVREGKMRRVPMNALDVFFGVAYNFEVINAQEVK